MREAVAPETQVPALASAFGLWCFLDISAHVVIVDVDVDQRPSPTHMSIRVQLARMKQVYIPTLSGTLTDWPTARGEGEVMGEPSRH